MGWILHGTAILRKTDRYIDSLPAYVVGAAIFLISLSLLYIDYLTGPYVPLSVFYLITLFFAIKYVDRRFAYLLVLLFATGKTYVKFYFNAADLSLAHWVWQFVSLAALYGVFGYLLDFQFSRRRRAEAQAELALTRAKAAERQLISIGEEVQQRFGRELHDDLGQRLMGAAFLSEVLYQKLKLGGNEAMGEASRITAVLNEAMDRTRKMAQGMYPAQLPERGLAGMLELFAEQAEAMYGIRCEFIDGAAHQPDNPEIAIHIFRVVQEAVSNAVRHGKAGGIVLRIGSERGLWTLEVEDDGCGLGNAGELSSGDGIGLRSMRYRAELIGAALKIENRLAGGTRVALGVPLERGEIHAA